MQIINYIVDCPGHDGQRFLIIIFIIIVFSIFDDGETEAMFGCLLFGVSGIWSIYWVQLGLICLMESPLQERPKSGRKGVCVVE